MSAERDDNVPGDASQHDHNDDLATHSRPSKSARESICIDLDSEERANKRQKHPHADHQPGASSSAVPLAVSDSNEYQAKPIPNRNDLILAEIEVVAAEIFKVIERLNQQPQNVFNLRYAMVPGKRSIDGLQLFEIAERKVPESSFICLKGWRRHHKPEIKALQVDPFNCKTPFNASHTVDEINKLNVAQLNEARRYAFFGESENCRVPLVVMLENSRAMLWHVNQACKVLNDSPSQLAHLQQKIASINQQIEALHAFEVRGSFCPPLYQFCGSAQHAEKIFSWVEAGTGLKPSQAVALHSFRPGFDCWSLWGKLINERRSRLLFVFKTTHNFVFGYFLNSEFQQFQNCSEKHIAFLFTLSNPHGIQPTRFVKSSNSIDSAQVFVSYPSLQIRTLSTLYNVNVEVDVDSGFRIGVSVNNTVDFSFQNDGLMNFGFNSNGVYPDTTGLGNLLFTGTAEAKLDECVVYQL